MIDLFLSVSFWAGHTDTLRDGLVLLGREGLFHVELEANSVATVNSGEKQGRAQDAQKLGGPGRPV